MPDLDENGFVRLNHDADRDQAITNCRLCDDDGYRGATICDHHDHTPAARRGMDLIRRAMGWPQP